MKSKWWLVPVTSGVVAVAGWTCVTTGRAQAPSPPPETFNEPATVRARSPFVQPNPQFGWAAGGIRMRSSGESKIEAAAKLLHDAPDEKAREAAKKKLVELLDKYFEEDMNGRKAEIEKIEKRVQSLRALLTKRASKKQDIIDLQVKVFENEADGLGLFNNSAPQAITLRGLPGKINFEAVSDLNLNTTTSIDGERVEVRTDSSGLPPGGVPPVKVLEPQTEDSN